MAQNTVHCLCYAWRIEMVSVLATMVAGVIAALSSHPPPRAVWIQRTLYSHENLEQVADQFSVTVDEIRTWNRLDPDVRAGTRLRILARSTPVPRQLQRVQLAEATTWDQAAVAWDVSVEELKQWNRRYRAYSSRLPPGAMLSVWRPSGIRHYPPPPSSAPLPEIEPIPGGMSVGRPQIGRLKHGVALPPSPDYSIQLESEAFGSTVAIWHLQRGLAEFRRSSGFQGLLRVGSISREKGGSLTGHNSHQSGRDVDLRLPAMAGAPEHGQLYASQIDWHVTWALVDAIVRTGGVQFIFLEERYHRRLRDAALRLGSDREWVDAVFEHILHARGHRSHLHVRFACGPQEPACKG